MKKKLVATLLAAMTVMSSMTVGVQAAETTEAAGVPKYVFLFIGDGMSYPQIQLTNYFLSANANAENAETVTVEGEEQDDSQQPEQFEYDEFPGCRICADV